MHRLDDLKLITDIDKSGMWNRLVNFPHQCEKAKRFIDGLDAPFYSEGIRNIVISGIGGSAAGGDILISYLRENLKIPAIINRGYSLPLFVNENTLTIVISYSGNTDETLASLKYADGRGSKIITITSGGVIEEFCSRKNIPIIKIEGGLQPRESIGYLFIPLLVLMEKMGFIEGQEADILETIELLKTLSNSYAPQSTENDAKMLSLDIHGKMPLLYGIHGLTDSTAIRWKNQFNENSKVPAFYNVFPELNHNEIEGWDSNHEFGKNFFVVILRSEDEAESISRQIEITKTILNERVGGIGEVWGKGGGRLARIFSLIYLGDFVSYYLAILNGVDPTPIKNIERLKKQLSKYK